MDPTLAEREAITAKVLEVVAYLQEHLGPRITAYLSGLADTAPVGRWSTGSAEPPELASTRLRQAYQATRLLVGSYDDKTARIWFFGSNTCHDDEAPAYLIRHAASPADLWRIISATQAFMETELT